MNRVRWWLVVCCVLIVMTPVQGQVLIQDSPHPPMNVQVQSTQDGMLVTWSPPASGHVTNYTVYKVLNKTSNVTISPAGYVDWLMDMEPIADVAPWQHWYMDQDVVGGELYIYVVTAWNGDSESPPSLPAIGVHSATCPVFQLWWDPPPPQYSIRPECAPNPTQNDASIRMGRLTGEGS